jgi:hypothetical protein
MCHGNDNGAVETRKLIISMLNKNPQRRPDPMGKIEKTLNRIIEAQ